MWDITNGRYQPGPKEILPIGNQQPHCGRNMFGLTSRLLLCFDRLIWGRIYGFAPTSKHKRSGQNADQFKVPRRGVGGCFGIRGEISLNGRTSNCPRGTGSQAQRGRQPARGTGRKGIPPPRSLRGVGHVATTSAKELQQVKPGGARDE